MTGNHIPMGMNNARKSIKEICESGALASKTEEVVKNTKINRRYAMKAGLSIVKKEEESPLERRVAEMCDKLSQMGREEFEEYLRLRQELAFEFKKG